MVKGALSIGHLWDPPRQQTLLVLTRLPESVGKMSHHIWVAGTEFEPDEYLTYRKVA